MSEFPLTYIRLLTLETSSSLAASITLEELKYILGDTQIENRRRLAVALPPRITATEDD